MPDINYIALAVVVAVGLVISVVWYGFLFGTLRQRLTGLSDSEMKELAKPGAFERMSLHIVGLIVVAFVLSYFVANSTATTFYSGILIGFFAWVVVAVVLLFGGILSRKARRENVYVVALDMTHWLLVFAVMAGILAIFS